MRHTFIIPLLALSLTTAHATTFTVTVTADSGANSLRQAITDANADTSASVGTPHRIQFSISSGVRTITCNSQLPTITRPTIIDGTTQPGFSSTPLIELTFGQFVTASTSGLRIQGDACAVKALAINGFGANAYGILLSASESSLIDRCRIGCNRLASGVVALKGTGTSRAIGLSSGGSHQVIACILGGTTRGVSIESGSTKNIIETTFIGVGISNTNLGCTEEGILLSSTATENTIGPDNVIGFNADAITVLSKSNTIESNFIGSATGGQNIKNTGTGILLSGDADNNTISDNTIRFNSGDGIRLEATGSLASTFATNCPIRRNICSGNAGLGINLRPLGEAASTVTLNDTIDPDSGPNDLQNFPVIAGLASDGINTTITGILNVSAGDSGTYLIDVFRNTSAEANGHGEGAFYLGTTATAVLGGAVTTGSWTITVPGYFPNQHFTATATLNAPGKLRTSEFSASLKANPGVLSFDTVFLLTLAESASPAPYTVIRNGGSYGPVGVTIQAIGGSASIPADFSPASAVLAFAGGETTKSANFSPVQDDIDEPNETLTLQLSSPTGGATLDTINLTRDITITDDDDAPTMIVFGPGAVIENVGTVSMRIVLTNPSASAISLTAQAFPANGADSSDFTGLETLATFTIPALQTIFDFNTVTIIDDNIVESTEGMNIVINTTSPAVQPFAELTHFFPVFDNDNFVDVKSSGITHATATSPATLSTTFCSKPGSQVDIEVSSDLDTWLTFSSQTVPPNGEVVITDLTIPDTLTTDTSRVFIRFRF
jgi:parallel beta-helix repeat protein